MVSRDEQQEQASASSERQEKNGSAAGSGAEGHAESAGRVVTTVNPRIVPAGSRSPAPSIPRRRPPRALLATIAAVVLIGLPAGALALHGAGDETKESAGPGLAHAPERQGGQEHGFPGSPSPPPPSDSSSGEEKEEGEDHGSEPGPPTSSGDSDEGGGKDRPPQDDGGHAPPVPERPPGGSGGGQGAAGVRIWNHSSDKCVDVPGGKGRDGTPLQIRTCSDTGAQRWEFAGDGTVRALGLCMDVANGSSENGTRIQLADCSGNPAQQFVLSEGSDLVNPQADKCVSVRHGDIRSGTPLQLWDCTGDDSQKWSPV